LRSCGEEHKNCKYALKGEYETMLKVKDILKTKDNNVWSISPQETAYKALEIMAAKNIGALMVIHDGQLVGIFSERDYARKVILKGKSSKETSVGELMTTTVYSIAPNKSIEENMAIMSASHSRHMPVIEDDTLIGVVSLGDIVNSIITSQKIEIQDLKNYIAGGEYTSEWSSA
jgi:CBS domain-containing protein